MSDYSNVIQGMFGSGPSSQVTSNIDANPDEAARAIELEGASGVPASIIDGNVDEFETNHKAAMASSIVNASPYLTEYVNSHPLAAKVSNDDWGNLGGLSSILNAFKGMITPPKAFSDEIGDFRRMGMGLVPSGEFDSHPKIARALAAGLSPVELGFRVLSGTVQAGAQEVLGEKLGSQVGSALLDPGLQATLEGIGPPGMIAASTLAMMNKLHPTAVKAAADMNKSGLDALNASADAAQQTATIGRAPQLVRQFVEQHTQGAQIGLNGAKVAELYGDRLPTADDGLLGWAPNITEQLDVARETGADVHIPMSDWVTYASPEVRKALELDTRVVSNGVTANEAATVLPAEPVIAEPLQIERQSAGGEPMFAIGDRKLTLNRLAPEVEGGQFGPEQGFHDFDLVNEKGQSVGTVNLSEADGGKTLNIEMINGLGEYYNPNRFGPALIRDLKTQLANEFPNAEWLTGHRVTGARDAVGDISGKSAYPRIRLRDPILSKADHDNLRDVFGGAWARVHPKVEAQIVPGDMWLRHENEIANAINEEARRIAPQADVKTVGGLKLEGEPIRGVYLPGRKSQTLVSLAFPDQVGTLRHEAIHHLRNEGFFTPEEWTTLEKAAKDEDWLGSHQIANRYPELGAEAQLEEAIADAFPKWKEEFEARKAQPGFEPTLVDKIFEKLDRFVEAIKERIGKIIGREPTFEDIFKSVDAGEVGGRTSTGKRTQSVMASKAPDGTEAYSPFQAAADVGMTIDQYRRYIKLVEERQAADVARSEAKALEAQRRRQSAEWKSQSEAMRPQVVEELNARPDIAADKFFGLGEYFGHQLETSYKLNRELLTPEQRAAIPESYQTGKIGISADDVASLFGYATGDQMLEGVAKISAARRDSGFGRDRFMRRVIDSEIQRRMEIEHGFLEKNIAEDARDQALSENQLDLLHEETHALALMSGEQGFNLTRDQLVSQIKDKFDALTMKSVSSDNYLRQAGRAGKAAEMALLSKDPAEAFRQKQVQYYNTVYANFAREVEKLRKKVDKSAKPFRKTEVKNIEPEYLNHIQNLLQQAGYKVGRSLENIQENLSRRGGQTLEQFADSKLSESWGLRDIPVADFIADGKMKSIDDLTTYEFKGFKQTLDALIKNAKDEQKIYREGETADRRDVVNEMKDHIEQSPLKPVNATATRWDKIKEVPKSFFAGLTNMETFLNRLGRRDPNSVFNRYVTYPAAAAANRKAALQRQFARAYQAIGEIVDKNKLVPSPLTDPLTGRPFARFTRGNVAQMLQNAGNRSNWEVLARGYGADPDALMQWLVANTTKSDWDRAQKLGTDIFDELVKLADQEYEHLNGVTIDKIPLEPISNEHGNFAGWYHPLVRDPIREGKSPLRGKTYDDSDFGHITTANGYTRKRTGSAYPIDLNPNMTPVRINQMIHDIAFRRFVLETQKIFKDSDLSNALTAHYGAEYNGRNFLMPWLEGIAGMESIPSKASALANRVSEFLRQNVISTYIGFNPFTALKHGPTAFVMSVRQVGMKDFLRATQDLYARSPSMTQANHEFVMKWSEELRRRERHWQDTIFGVHKQIEGASGFRDHMIEKGSWMVAQSDMLSAKPTWLAAYRKAQERGETHGASIDYADAQVRFAHGSTAITNQPALVANRAGGAVHGWLTSVYGFFGTNMQRRIELAHDINDTYKLVKEGEFTKAAGNLFPISRDVFTYVIWPTMVEEWVTGLTTDDHKGMLEHLATATLLGLGSSVLYARDIVHGLIGGNDPSVGLISSFLHDEVKGVKALTRKDAFTRQRMGKTVGDTLAAFGHLSGMAPKTVDNAIHFGIDLVNNVSHPHTAADYFRGITKGTTEPRKVK